MSENKTRRKAKESVEEVTHEMVARRAYEISQSDQAGTAEENWVRAEAELSEGQDASRERPIA